MFVKENREIALNIGEKRSLASLIAGNILAYLRSNIKIAKNLNTNECRTSQIRTAHLIVEATKEDVNRSALTYRATVFTVPATMAIL